MVVRSNEDRMLSASVFWRLAALFIMACVMGTGLVTAAYSLPIEPIRDSAYKSLETLESEGEYPFILSKRNAQLDNYSDARMLDIASFDGQSGFCGAMAAQEGRAAYDGDTRATMAQNLRASLENSGGMYSESYARYWNGYTALLKPLLFLGLDLNAIRLLNLVCQVSLVSVLFIQLIRSRLWSVSVALLLCLLTMHFYIMPFSMMFSIDFYIMIGAMICIAFWPYVLRVRSNALLFFFGIGMVTSYFDLMICPLITLGFPLAFYLYRCNCDSARSNSALFKFTCFCILLWAAGYGLFWAAKWVIAAVFCGIDALGEASSVIQTRISTTAFGEGFSYMQLAEAIGRHFGGLPLAVGFAGVMSLIVCVILGFFLRRGKRVSFRHGIALSASYFAIVLVPFLWTLFASNHAFVHNWFAYRNFSIVPFSLLLCVAGLLAARKGGLGDVDLPIRRREM